MIITVDNDDKGILKERIPFMGPGHPSIDDAIFEIKRHFASVQGYAITANQVGRSVRLFVIKHNEITGKINGKDISGRVLKTCIDPQIVGEVYERDVEVVQEGCLSILDEKGRSKQYTLKRYNKIRVKYFDHNRELKEEEWEGFIAHIFQHEYDHLEGVLISDKGVEVE